MTTSTHTADVLVVGGGPAGLSAGIYLARYARSVIVFDAGYGRSTHHQVNHNYLGFPGGVAAVTLRELGRRQLGEYPEASCIEHRVSELTRDGAGFVAHTDAGDFQGRAVIICTGVLDHYPTFTDWEDYVGRSMFWCLTCDGYSNRGRRILVVGRTDEAAAESLQLQRFSDTITLLTNGDSEIGDASIALLARAGIPVIVDRIREVRGQDGKLSSISTHGGQTIEAEVMFSLQGATPKSELAAPLGVSLTDAGWISVNSEQTTNVPGVFAAGDVTRLHAHQVATAVHEGGQAACAANYFLYPPELRLE